MTKIVVITSNLLTFEVEGDHWTCAFNASGTLSADIIKKSPTPGGPSIAVANFPDVHAIYYKDSCEMVTVDDDEDS